MLDLTIHACGSLITGFVIGWIGNFLYEQTRSNGEHRKEKY